MSGLDIVTQRLLAIEERNMLGGWGPPKTLKQIEQEQIDLEADGYRVHLEDEPERFPMYVCAFPRTARSRTAELLYNLCGIYGEEYTAMDKERFDALLKAARIGEATRYGTRTYDEVQFIDCHDQPISYNELKTLANNLIVEGLNIGDYSVLVADSLGKQLHPDYPRSALVSVPASTEANLATYGTNDNPPDILLLSYYPLPEPAVLIYAREWHSPKLIVLYNFQV